jgi:hypothetical protein
MRLHPAVATALLLVGGVLLALPVYKSLQFTTPTTSVEEPAWRFLVSLLSMTMGLVFILIAVVFSFESRTGSGDSA